MVPALDALTSVSLWDALSDGLALIDRDGVMVAVNAPLAAMVGTPADELVGRNVTDLVPPTRRFVHAELMDGYFEAPRARSMFAGGRLELCRDDGTLMPALIALAPLDTDEGRLVIASVRDDTERRETERRLARATRERLRVETSERIARELHDTVIAELFATGVSLEAVRESIPEGLARERVSSTVDTLDRVIVAVRNAITGLRRPSDRSVRDRLVDLVANMTPILRAEPSLVLPAELDTVVADGVADDLIAVVGEALTNIVRHAEARRVSVQATIDGSELVVEVSDDGVGIDPEKEATGGVANMVRRARDLGGECEVVPHDGGGTRVRWRVPLTHTD